jgi:hypothetical protein
VLGVLGNPGILLVVSQLLLGFVGSFVVLNVFGHESHFLLGFSEGVGGVLSQFCEGNNLSFVISNGLLEVVDQLFTRNLVIFENGISSLLVSFHLGGDVIHQQVDLINWSSSGQMKLDNREDGVTHGFFVNFS